MKILRQIFSVLILGILLSAWIIIGQASGAFDQAVLASSPGLFLVSLFMLLFCTALAYLTAANRRGRSIAIPVILLGLFAFFFGLPVLKQIVHVVPMSSAENWWFLTTFPAWIVIGFNLSELLRRRRIG